MVYYTVKFVYNVLSIGVHPEITELQKGVRFYKRPQYTSHKGAISGHIDRYRHILIVNGA